MLIKAAVRRVQKMGHGLRGDGAQTQHALAQTPIGRADRPYQSRLNNALWRELRYVGLPELLHADDAISMAFSLESRLPFLDHRLVEFCFSLQYDEKMSEGWTK